jgi:hypothetical protein
MSFSFLSSNTKKRVDKGIITAPLSPTKFANLYMKRTLQRVQNQNLFVTFLLDRHWASVVFNALFSLRLIHSLIYIFCLFPYDLFSYDCHLISFTFITTDDHK